MVGLFGMTAASTGASERTLKRVGTPYEKVGGPCCVMPHSRSALLCDSHDKMGCAGNAHEKISLC